VYGTDQSPLTCPEIQKKGAGWSEENFASRAKERVTVRVTVMTLEESLHVP
jgi:hypothetical protein